MKHMCRSVNDGSNRVLSTRRSHQRYPMADCQASRPATTAAATTSPGDVGDRLPEFSRIAPRKNKKFSIYRKAGRRKECDFAPRDPLTLGWTTPFGDPNWCRGAMRCVAR